MRINTRVFGEIEVDEGKVIHFVDGIIGFPECKNFTLIYDEDRDKRKSICWLQSLDEPVFALPVIDPLIVYEGYNPHVETELFKSLGNLEPDQTFILVTVTIPKDITELSVNLKAPIIINVESKKACQIIVDDELPVKHQIYDILQAKKAGE